MGGMGMGMFSMNPFSALLGGLFGLPFFWTMINILNS
jgi:hypothetical protein